MIDYETYCKLHDHRTRQGLSIAQTARALGLHPETVSKWWLLPLWECTAVHPLIAVSEKTEPPQLGLWVAHETAERLRALSERTMIPQSRLLRRALELLFAEYERAGKKKPGGYTA